MSPEDTALCQQAIDLYNAGQKQQAYEQFCAIYNRGNPEDVTLLFWLAYTTPQLDEAQRSMETIAHLEPDHPKLPELRERVSRKQQRLIMRTFPPDRYGPVMSCPYCHRTGPARIAKKISIGGWIWFASFFLLFLCFMMALVPVSELQSMGDAEIGRAHV